MQEMFEDEEDLSTECGHQDWNALYVCVSSRLHSRQGSGEGAWRALNAARRSRISLRRVQVDYGPGMEPVGAPSTVSLPSMDQWRVRRVCGRGGREQGGRLLSGTRSAPVDNVVRAGFGGKVDTGKAAGFHKRVAFHVSRMLVCAQCLWARWARAR